MTTLFWVITVITIIGCIGQSLLSMDFILQSKITVQIIASIINITSIITTILTHNSSSNPSSQVITTPESPSSTDYPLVNTIDESATIKYQIHQLMKFKHPFRKY